MDVVTQVIFGTAAAVEAALVKSGVSHRINTAFVERHNGTDRNRNARKVRKTYCFSKDWWVRSRGHVLHDVQLQLLLAGEDAEDGIW